MEKLTTFSPFNQEPSLRNIITGVNATECVNVHELFTEGESIIRQMEEQPVFHYKYQRKLKVKTLASSKEVVVAHDTALDPSLLFQIFLMVSQIDDLNRDMMMNNELSSYPLSLFEVKKCLAQAR